MEMNVFSLHQHANGENAWVGIDGRSGDIVDMKERKVFLFICTNASLTNVCMSKHHNVVHFRSGIPTALKRRRSRQQLRLLACF